MSDSSHDIILEDSRQTLYGPGGIKLVLDAEEIHPDDPGMGTPMLVWLRGESMTLNCAEDNSRDLGCNEEQTEWIWEISDAANDWLDAQYSLIK